MRLKRTLHTMLERLRILVPLPIRRFVYRCIRLFRRLVVLPSRRFSRRQIPVAMITGTKGKTTTARMLARILDEAGHRVGLTSTDGIVIDGVTVVIGDSAGYRGARRVLKDPRVTAAVLETARGGLLKEGPYLDRCDVAALLNVDREQIEIDGVETLDQMAQVKRQVTDAARGVVVLNADDPRSLELTADYPIERTTLFSLHGDNPTIARHIESGGVAYVRLDELAGDRIERRTSDDVTVVLPISELPSSRGGAFFQNIANALAAAALAEGLGVPLDSVRRALGTFQNSLEHSAGRLNFIEGYAQTILLEPVAIQPAVSALVESLPLLDVPGRRVCMITAPGNRPDWLYEELGQLLTPSFDCFVCFEVDQYRRARAPGEIPELLRDGLVAAGANEDDIHLGGKGYENATAVLAGIVKRDDFVVVTVGDPVAYVSILERQFARHRLAPQPEDTARSDSRGAVLQPQRRVDPKAPESPPT